MDAFRLALSKGATGLETDVWLTADGVAVLSHDGRIRGRLPWRRRPLSSLDRAKIPPEIATLADLYRLAGEGVDVFVDVKDPDAVEEIVRIAGAAGSTATRRLWLAHGGYDYSDWRTVASWRHFDPDVHLVDSTTIKRFDLSPKDYAVRATKAGIEVLNLPAKEWTAGLVETFQSTGLRCFAFRANKSRTIERLASLGIDGIHSDHVDRLVSGLGLQPPEFVERPDL